ncbi:MAG: hypothetical protein ACSLFN_16280 [Candidatus Limnocylindrales bacterium]
MRPGQGRCLQLAPDLVGDPAGLVEARAIQHGDELLPVVAGDWFLPFWPIVDDRLDYLRAVRPLDPIERIAQVGASRPTDVLFQFGRRDFFIAAMTGLEFRAATPAGSELLACDDEHAMRDP